MNIGQLQAFHEVLLITPLRFEQGAEAVLAVREQCIVVLNLTAMGSVFGAKNCRFRFEGVEHWMARNTGLEIRLLFAPANVDVNLS